jgi:hypothetical protein
MSVAALIILACVVACLLGMVLMGYFMGRGMRRKE